MEPGDLHNALRCQSSFAAMPIRFEVSLREHGEVDVALFMTTRDPVTGEHITQRTATRTTVEWLDGMSETTAMEWVYHTLVRVAFIHEAGEAFMWSERRPMDPHAVKP